MDSSAGAEGISFPAFRGVLGRFSGFDGLFAAFNFFSVFGGLLSLFRKSADGGGIANGNTNRMGYSARAGGFRLRISGRALGL